MTLVTAAEASDYRDVVCSICGRHNRDVRVVASEAGIIICQVCVAKCAQIFDDEVGVGDRQDWSARWPLKQAPSHEPS
jgi:hypothetical protein